FADLGFAGVRASNSRALGGSDNTSFNQAGCRASEGARTRSNTSTTPGTPTSTLTSESSKTTLRNRPSSSPPPASTWRCAINRCRDSRERICPRFRRRDHKGKKGEGNGEWGVGIAESVISPFPISHFLLQNIHPSAK